MLLIWDLHITSKIKDTLITELKTFISAHPEDQHIVFLWDYVYHFSYDRNALLALYNLFGELFEQGKQVYILAGNHDRLGDSFVFEEAQKAFWLLDKYNISHVGKLKFITEPFLETIEGQQVLFFPYMIKNLELPQRESIPQQLQSISYLAESTNKNEQKSRIINNLLASYTEKYPNLLVIHHYYLHNTQFPGQKSRFSYKDIALSEVFLQNAQIKMISWHLHQGFSLHNYLCTGSVWSTSSLEINQQKYLFQITWNTIKATPITINPYIQLATDHQLNKEEIKNQIENIVASNQSNFTTSSRPIDFGQKEEIPLNKVNLSLKVDQVNYEEIQKYLDEDLITQLRDLKLKKALDVSSADLLEKLKVSSSDLTTFADWKTILKSYIQQKFGNEYPQYEKILQELKVI